jgi:hypothetical protein
MQTVLLFRKNLKHLSAEASTCCDPHSSEPYRFVILNNILYIGDFRFHVQLAITAFLGDVPELSSELIPEKESYWISKLKPLIAGAGNIDEQKNVVRWKSTGFNIETPEELKAKILKNIQEASL